MLHYLMLIKDGKASNCMLDEVAGGLVDSSCFSWPTISRSWYRVVSFLITWISWMALDLVVSGVQLMKSPISFFDTVEGFANLLSRILKASARVWTCFKSIQEGVFLSNNGMKVTSSWRRAMSTRSQGSCRSWDTITLIEDQISYIKIYSPRGEKKVSQVERIEAY